MAKNSGGWIWLHRKFLKWEWWDNLPVRTLFIYMLLRANYEETEWRGVKLRRGEFITSRRSLAKATGLTEQQVKTALKNLQTTHEITSKSTNKQTTVYICKYDDYQPTNNPQSNQQERQQTTTDKENKKINKIKKPPIVPLSGGRVSSSKNEEVFDLFRSSYPGRKRGLQTEFRVFQKHRDWREVLPQLSEILKSQVSARQELSAAGEFVPHWKNLSTWLNQRCWEEETSVQEQESQEKLYQVEGKLLPESKYKRLKAAGEIVADRSGKMIFKHR